MWTGRVKPLFPLLALLTLALTAALPLWGPGLVNTRGGGDSPFLLWRVHQLAANLRDGAFPARWMPDAAYGLGYPLFSYYAALPYYAASLLTIAGLDILAAIQLTQTLGFLLAAAASYGWFRRVLSSQAAAWLGAAAYTFAPFHLVNVYVRGDSLSEFYAFVFYPLILWAIDNAAGRRTVPNVIALGLAYAGLIITHTISAAIFTPFVLLYAAFQVLGSKPGETWRVRLITVGAGLALGLALAAWYWLPALLETRYIQPATLTEGYFYYGGHFRSANLVQPTPGFVYDTTSRQASPFAMGWVQAVMAGLGIMAYGVARAPCNRLSWVEPGMLRLTLNRPRVAPPVVFCLLFSTFMITPLSRPLWDHLPVLPMVQFPWRFLSVQALFAALVTALAVEHLARWRGAAAVGGAAALALAVMLPLRPDRLWIDASDVTVQRLQLYELFTANIGTTITYEWLPRDVNPRLYTSELVMDPTAPPRAFAVAGELRSAREIEHRPTTRTWQIDASSPATLVFPLLYWPGWRATVDGAPTAARPAPSSGRIVLDVPPGPHTVVLQLGRTPLRLAAELVSLLALLVCTLRFTLHVLRSTFHASHLVPPCIVAGYALSAVSLVSLATRSAAPFCRSSESMDFIQMPYLHAGAVQFEAGAGSAHNTLNGYAIDPERAGAGQPVNVTLDWVTAESPLTVTVSLVGMSEHLPDLRAPIVLDHSTARLDSTARAATRHTLRIPPDMPTGVYLVQVRLAGAGGEQWAYTASGARLGFVYLRPVYVRHDRPADDETVAATFGDRIRLHRVDAEQTTPTQLLIRLDWSASRPVAENYGLAVRLYNARGDRWASMDVQPGYGFLPTAAWSPGVGVSDRLVLPLPEGLPPRGDYELEIILYDLANNLAGIGQHVQPGIALTQYARRSPDSPALARLGPHLALASLDAPAAHPRGAPVLRFDAGWLAVAAPAADVLARWSLVDETGAPVATHTVRLDAAAWPAGAYVLDAVHMPVPAGLDAGRYRLVVAWLDAQTGAEIGQVHLERAIEVAGRPRRFDLPPLDQRVGVNLGGQVTLEGYTLMRDQNAIRLTLAWRAQRAIATDYTVFVHLLGPEGELVRQHDAMPLGNTYPTSWWSAGEVVTDVVTLSLSTAPPGPYRLAVGMYDNRTSTRLEAYAPGGQRLPDDRIILPASISWP